MPRGVSGKLHVFVPSASGRRLARETSEYSVSDEGYGDF